MIRSWVPCSIHSSHFPSAQPNAPLHWLEALAYCSPRSRGLCSNDPAQDNNNNNPTEGTQAGGEQPQGSSRVSLSVPASSHSDSACQLRRPLATHRIVAKTLAASLLLRTSLHFPSKSTSFSAFFPFNYPHFTLICSYCTSLTASRCCRSQL
jgi:hypothetical protein